MNCCICGKTIENFGNNPYPYVRVEKARCCNNCNAVHVTPLRLKLRDKKRDPDLYIENGLEPSWKGSARYQDFPEIKPTPFNILFKDRDFETVQLHDIAPEDGIIGFVGVISWINNELNSLDGDNYYPEMLVYGYKETDEVLDILVKDW